MIDYTTIITKSFEKIIISNILKNTLSGFNAFASKINKHIQLVSNKII